MAIDRHFTEQELVRREKLKQLRADKKNPFVIAKFARTATIEALQSQYEASTLEQLAEKPISVKIAGRLRTQRIKGKAGFAHLQDASGQMQIYVRLDEVGDEAWTAFKALDLGDILGVEGTLMRTHTGELTVRVQKWVLLAKALRPLPEKFHGLTDIEERYRRRYVDLIVNPEVKTVFETRTKIIRAMQTYLDRAGFLEVETPMLQPILGGALAKPFSTFYNSLNAPYYLRVASELYLKELVVGGFEKVYEIGRMFRNEGIDTRHNPEFTSIEIYEAYTDMVGMMDLTEALIKYVCQAIGHPLKFKYQDYDLDLEQSWTRINMLDAIHKVTGIDFNQPHSLKQALALAKEHNLPLETHHTTVGHIINLFFEEKVEATLIQPTFVYHYPLVVSPLAKPNTEQPQFADRFELFIGGREYANAYSELNDPEQQQANFELQLLEREQGNEEANELDLAYIEALEQGLPPTGGLGIGIDRLIMLLTNQPSIRDVILFPQLRKKAKS